MKKKLLTIIALVMVLVTGFASLPALAAETGTIAAEKALISWDLANGKTVKVKCTYPGYGTGTMKLKLKNYKDIENADGNREITFSLVFRTSRVYGSTMSSDQFLEFAKCYFFWNREPFHYYFSVIDLETGACLETANDKNVTVEKIKDWSNTWYALPLEDPENCHLNLPDKTSVTVRITAPKDYKDMAIVAGGLNLVKDDISINPAYDLPNFMSGEMSFYEINAVSTKGFCHGMKIN